MKTKAVSLLIWFSACGCALSQSASDYSWQRDAQSISLLKQSEIVWRFCYEQKQTKPYFDPVALPGHPSMTWVSPPDHPWHYGVWFSWKYLNGVNYWEEDPKTHTSAGVTHWKDVKIDTTPSGAATISLELRYAPAGKPDVLTEKRVIRITAPDESGRYDMDWVQTFVALADVALDRTPPPGEPHSKPWGGYGGFSVRFAKAFTQWKAVTANGLADMQAHGKKSTAADFSGVVGGVSCGMAILDHPDNPNYPTQWYHVMRPETPFAYFNPAILFHRPLSMKEGEKMTLRYRLIVHPGQLDAMALNEESAAFGG